VANKIVAHNKTPPWQRHAIFSLSTKFPVIRAYRMDKEPVAKPREKTLSTVHCPLHAVRHEPNRRPLSTSRRSLEPKKTCYNRTNQLFSHPPWIFSKPANPAT
jgi:hypothetical protein